MAIGRLMISLQLRYFAELREQLGRSDETLQLPGEISVAELRQHLLQRGATWQRLAEPQIRAAVNQVLATEQTRLASGDEVAFFPPVTGG